MTKANHQDLNEQEDSPDADSNPSFEDVPNDKLEDDQEPWVEYRMTTYWPQMASRRGSSDRAGYMGHKRGLPSATKNAGDNSSPTGSQRYQPSRKGIGSKEVWPRDGKTTSSHAYNLLEFSDKQRSHGRHDEAHYCTGWLELGLHGKRLCGQPRQRQPNQQHSDKQRTRPKPVTTTKAARRRRPR